MPKIPWTPPERPPRIKVEPAHPLAKDLCVTCEGQGWLDAAHWTGDIEKVDCWVCKGSGAALPPPPEGKTGNDSFEQPTWSGQVSNSEGTHDDGVHIQRPTGWHHRGLSDVDYTEVELRAQKFLNEFNPRF